MTPEEKRLLTRLQEIKRDYQKIVGEKERIIAAKEETIRFLRAENAQLRDSLQTANTDIILLERDLKEATQ